MQVPENNPPRFYFALPRFVAFCGGRNSGRIENNWIEANIVGGAVFLISYLSALRALAAGLPMWGWIALLLPTLALVYLGWILQFYFHSVLIRLLRAAGLMRHLSQSRAQTIFIGAIITGLAWLLLQNAGWSRLIGAIWLGAVLMNLLAATILGLAGRKQPQSAL